MPASSQLEKLRVKPRHGEGNGGSSPAAYSAVFSSLPRRFTRRRAFDRFSEAQADAHLVALDEGRERNRAATKRCGQPASGEISVNGGLHVLPMPAASTHS